jgi:hypothetical protein
MVTKSPSRPVSERPRKVGSDVRTRPALSRVEPPASTPIATAAQTGRRLREQRATLPMAGATAPRVLVVGTRPTEIASVARSFHEAGAFTRSCLVLEQLGELLEMQWSCVMVDLRHEKDVRRLVSERGLGAPVLTYVADSALAHRGRVLPLARADAEELLASLAPRT